MEKARSVDRVTCLSVTRAAFRCTPPMSQPITPMVSPSGQAAMPLELIPVLDLAGGRAVHAVGGDRARYAPVGSVLATGQPGDALSIARAYRRTVGVHRCYVADLDAITGGAVQRELLGRLASPEGFAGQLLVDAGIANVA